MNKENLQNILSKLPIFFKSNHFYQRLLGISPILFIEIFTYGNETWLYNACNEIFYYGLNHG